jgi:ribosome-binding factor A
LTRGTRPSAESFRHNKVPQEQDFFQTMSRRTLKAAEAIREVVSMAILTEIKDPRVADVTVTRVELSGDMREAKVYVTVMGSETKQQLSLRGLRSAAGFLQQKITDRIDTRYTPRIAFQLDKGEMNASELAHIFAKIAAERAADSASQSPEVDDSQQRQEN